MATTTYIISKVVDGELIEVDTKSKKSTAIEIAERLRGLELIGVQVATNKGTVVFDQAAPNGKRVIINKTAPWTRVDEREPELAEGVKVPNGFEVTYLAPRNKAAVCRHPETLDYLVLDLVTGDAHPAKNCHEAGVVMKAIKAERKALVDA